MLKTTIDKKGWLLPYLIALDDMFYKRWQYWMHICVTNKIPQEPIPFIRFKSINEYPQKEVQKNLRKCINYAAYQLSHPFESFVDWILWGFNQGKEFPAISDKIDDYWYRTFNLGLFYKEAADHWPDFVMDVMGRNNPLGFFATPASITEMITLMQFGDKPQHEHKKKSVLDPTCGTGGMLLFASNYSLNLYGQDISLLLTKAAKINAFIYMPWMVYKPKHLTIFHKQISEKQFSSGVKIPVCTNCNEKNQSFFVDLQTDYACELSTEGNFTLRSSKLSRDLIAKNLKPQNIACAKCDRKEES